MLKRSTYAFSLLAAGTCLIISFSQTLQALTKASASETKREPPKLKLDEPLPKNLFVELSKAVNPAVVSITTTQNVRGM